MKRFLALLACLVLVSCGDGAGETAPEAVVRVGDASVTAEVADDEASRTRGLSGRDRLAPDAGMLFVLPGDSPSFWMMFRIAVSGRKLRCFFSSSKMICARVTEVRSSLVLLSTIFTSSPLRIISEICSSVTYRLCWVS